MARRISRDLDDRSIGLTFHTCPAQMSVPGLSFLAMQKLFDEYDKSFYRCHGCGWAGRGRELAAMEHDSHEAYAFDSGSQTWYECPNCELEINIHRPLMALVASKGNDAPEKGMPERPAASRSGWLTD